MNMTDLKTQVETAIMARGGKQRGVEIHFQCAAHEDEHASASYNTDKGVWCCFACGESGNYWHLGCLLGLIRNGQRRDGYRETRRWQIRNIDGRLEATHTRLDCPGQRKKVEWERNGKRKLNGLRTDLLPLYGVHLLPGAPSDSDKLVNEGEKPTDALLALGFVSLGTVTGANSTPSVETLRPLAEHQGRVFLCRDKDAPGYNHMKRIAARLKRMGKETYMVTWPGVPNKGDAYDYIAADHTADDVKGILKAAELYQGEAEPEDAGKKDTEGEVKVVCVPGFILRDGTIGEMIIDAFTGERTFVLRTPSGATTKVSEYTISNTTYKPMIDDLAGRTVSFASDATEYNSLGSLLAEVRKFIHQYVELPANFEAITALYILLSWVYEPLPTLPYLRALGDYGTGKTRFQEVVGAIAFRAIRAAGATTPSPIFRILDIYRGSLVLDEADFNRSDAATEIVKILNSGYKPGSPVLRSEPTSNKKWEPHSYDVFGPKILATRKRWADRALESRCLTWESEGLTREDIPIVLGTRFQTEAATLRCKLLGFRLDYLPNVMSLNLEDARPVGNLEPRLQEILLPLKAIAQGDKALETTLDEFIMGMQEELEEDRRNSLPALVLEAILFIREEGGELSIKAITERLNQGDLVKEHLERPERGISARRVGPIVKGLGLKTRQATTSRRAIIQWDNRRVAILCRRYSFLIPQNNPSHPSPEADILHQHPSPGEAHPSHASPLSDMKSSESEGSEGCEASFPGVENQVVDRYETALDMSVEKALEIWRPEGAPTIHLGPGENCSDLEEFLSRLGVKPEHLQVVRAWLEKVIRSKKGGLGL